MSQLLDCNCVVKRAKITYCPVHRQAQAMFNILTTFKKSGMGCRVCLSEPCTSTCPGPKARAILRACEEG